MSMGGRHNGPPILWVTNTQPLISPRPSTTPGSNEHLWELFDDVADLLLRGRAHLQVLVHGRREALRLFLDQQRILREAAEDTLYTLLRSYLSGTQICTIPVAREPICQIILVEMKSTSFFKCIFKPYVPTRVMTHPPTHPGS